MTRRFALAVSLAMLVVAWVLDPWAYAFVRAALLYEYWGEMRELLTAAKFLGSGLGTVVIGLIVGVLDREQGWRRARAVWLAFIVTGSASVLIKVVSGRERPSHQQQVPGHERCAFHGPRRGFDAPFQSFPSGHTTTSFAVATTLASFYPPARSVFYAVAAATGINRVAKHQHFLSDVVAGGLLGFWLATWLNRRSRRTGTADIDRARDGP